MTREQFYGHIAVKELFVDRFNNLQCMHPNCKNLQPVGYISDVTGDPKACFCGEHKAYWEMNGGLCGYLNFLYEYVLSKTLNIPYEFAVI